MRRFCAANRRGRKGRDLIHERHFTVEEANALLDGLRPVLRELRDASELLTDAEVHSLLADAAPGNGWR